jgi:hypothetical protein
MKIIKFFSCRMKVRDEFLYDENFKPKVNCMIIMPDNYSTTNLLVIQQQITGRCLSPYYFNKSF